MDDKRILELLSKKFAGEANELELQELQSLFHQYPDAIYYEEILGQLWRPGEPDPVETSKLDAIFEAHKLKYGEELDFGAPENEPGRQKKWIGNVRIKYVLLILLPVIIIGGILLVKNFTRHSASQYTTIISGKGVRKQICLPDGTKVWLNSESNLSFDNEMTQKITRDVTLVGEAFFEVAHDKKHPFIVHTEKMAIKVLGTEFNVMAYPNDKQATATLIRGSIELSVNKFPQQKIILKPSERFAMIDNKKNQDGESKETGTFENVTLKLENLSPIKVQGTEYIAETAWVDNKLVFKNESFSELVPKLERWFNVRIKIDDPEKLKYHFTGIFTNENIDQALNAMKVIKPFNFKINENDVNIY